MNGVNRTARHSHRHAYPPPHPPPVRPSGSPPWPGTAAEVTQQQPSLPLILFVYRLSPRANLLGSAQPVRNDMKLTSNSTSGKGAGVGRAYKRVWCHVANSSPSLSPFCAPPQAPAPPLPVTIKLRCEPRQQAVNERYLPNWRYIRLEMQWGKIFSEAFT